MLDRETVFMSLTLYVQLKAQQWGLSKEHFEKACRFKLEICYHCHLVDCDCAILFAVIVLLSNMITCFNYMYSLTQYGVA